MTLTEFLLSRIDEREQDLHARGNLARCIYEGGYEGTSNCDCGAVDRELAECQAKRRTITHFDAAARSHHHYVADNGRFMLGQMALAYTDHPDYDQAWRPDAPGAPLAHSPVDNSY